MSPWGERSPEEKALLNPAFLSVLIWYAARGHVRVSGEGLPFEEAFVVLPTVLHRGTRERLPRSRRTSLAGWIARNALVPGNVAGGAKGLAEHAREAILFGASFGLTRLEGGRIHSEERWQRRINRWLRDASDEVRLCARRAEFVGGWFADNASAAGVLMLLGVRP